MNIRIFLMMTFMLLGSFEVSARKPAVEDSFGVISENYLVVEKGLETPINFNKNPIELGKLDSVNSSSPNSSIWIALTGLLAMIFLPIFMWLRLTSDQKRIDDEVFGQEVPMQRNNVTHLEEYRKENQKKPDDQKKAS